MATQANKRRSRTNVANAIKRAGLEEREHIGDLTNHFVAPGAARIFQSHRRFSAGEAKGSITLGWYRGQHKGHYDAYLAIRKKFPAAARAILKAFNLRTDGAKGL